MFHPNVDCLICKAAVKTDIYGQRGTEQQFHERCAVVKLRSESQHTTVRADSGASRGHADEFVTINRILLSPKTKAAIDDKLVVHGMAIRIKTMHPRITTSGRLDHYEVEGELWG